MLGIFGISAGDGLKNVEFCEIHREFYETRTFLPFGHILSAQDERLRGLGRPRKFLWGGQPFFNERKDVVLLFSGECFMDPETRTPLSQKRNMSFSRQLAVG